MSKQFQFKTADPEQKLDLAALGIAPSTYEQYPEADLRKMIAESVKEIDEHTILKGRIVAVRESHVLVDVGYKSEGVIPRDEFPNADAARVGDEVEVFLVQKEDREGNLIVSKGEADRQRAWERTKDIFDRGGRVTGKVMRKVKGGLMVDIGLEAFLPSSQISLQNIKNVDDYLGQDIEVKIIKLNDERKNAVVSRRELLDEERALRKRDFLGGIKVGDILRGKVKNITDFGAFIDLDGIDGLLHLTDMRWGRIGHPSEMLQIGQPVDVMTIGIDYDKERVSLGIKQMYDNPWLDVDKKYPSGTHVAGRVVNILPYGAFIELEEGVEGLIHISEFSWTRKVNHPSEFVQLNDQVKVMVLNVDQFDQKISLGLRQTQDNPWDTIEQRYPEGARVKGVVRNLTTYGAFVELEDGIDGLVHVSDMSWTRKVNHPSEILRKGQEIEAAVLNVNPNERKIALGLKQLVDDPWDHIHDHYKEGEVITGKITNTTSFGAFVQLQNDIEGLIHISELADRPVSNVKDVVKVGDDVIGKIMRIDASERKIAVSIKAYEIDKALSVATGPTVEPKPPQQPVERKRFESGIDLEEATRAAAQQKADAAQAEEPKAPEAPAPEPPAQQ